MTEDLTGREAARRAQENLTAGTQAGEARGLAYAVLAVALATAGQWEGEVSGEVLCGATFTSVSGSGMVEEAECELPDGHEGCHVGHLLGSFRIEDLASRLRS